MSFKSWIIAHNALLSRKSSTKATRIAYCACVVWSSARAPSRGWQVTQVFLEMFKYYIVSESPNFVDERYYEIRGLKFGYCYLSSTCIQCSIAFSHETRIRSCHERVVNIYIHKCSWKNHNVHVSFHIKHYSKSSEIKYKYIVFIPIHNELKVKTNEKQCTCTSNWLCIWRYG